MTTKEEKIKQMERKIEVCKIELQKLQSEIYVTPIDELDITLFSKNTLKRKGFNFLGELAIMPKEELKKLCLGEKCFAEITAILLNTLIRNSEELKTKIIRATEQQRLKKEQEDRLANELLNNLLSALEVYAKIEEQAKACGVKWYHMTSSLHVLLRCVKCNKSYKINKKNVEKFISSFTEYCKQCIRGEHPLVYTLLTAEAVNIEMIKEAILEDFRENNQGLRPRTKSYNYAKTFIAIVEEYKEKE